jgi:hypothetical protein
MLPEVLLVEVAAELRQKASLEQPPYSTSQIINSCFRTASVTGRRLPDGVDEVVARTDTGILIVYHRDLPIAEQRFAIAHALAHVIFDGADGGCGIGVPGDPEREARADRFALELLVPLEELAPYVGRWPSCDEAENEAYLDQVDMIASHFNVSASRIDERIRELLRRLK